MFTTVTPNTPRLPLQLRHLDPAQRKAALGEIFTLLRADRFRERREVIRWLEQIASEYRTARRRAKANAKVAEARDKGKLRRNYWYARMAQLAEEMRDDPHARYLFSPDFREEAERLGKKHNPSLKPEPKAAGARSKGLNAVVGNVALLYIGLTDERISGKAFGRLARLVHAVCVLLDDHARRFTIGTIKVAIQKVRDALPEHQAFLASLPDVDVQLAHAGRPSGRDLHAQPIASSDRMEAALDTGIEPVRGNARDDNRTNEAGAKTVVVVQKRKASRCVAHAGPRQQRKVEVAARVPRGRSPCDLPDRTREVNAGITDRRSSRVDVE